MANPTASPSLVTQQLEASPDAPQQRAALRALMESPRTKSKLAVATYGVDGVTARSMMTSTGHENHRAGARADGR
jgi:hypothetical protein